MKRTSLIVVGVLVLAGVVAWSQRFDLALNHMRGEGGRSGGELTAFAWGTLESFTDRPELEAFVREELLASAKTVLETGTSGALNQWSLLSLSGRVYERQPERVDQEVLTAALVVECRDDCTSAEAGSAPAFETLYWNEEVRASAAFRMAMRSAALAIARSASTFPTASYVAIVGALADGEVEADPALAAAVASFVLAADRGASETAWLTDALDRIAGPGGSAAAWANALTEAPAADLSRDGWNAAIDILRRSPPPSASLADAVLSHCVRRSTASLPVDEGCIDLGLAWRGAWTERLQAALSRGGTGADAVRQLLAAHEAARTRTWHEVIADWRATDPPPGSDIVIGERGSRTSAMSTSAYRPAFQRRDARDIELLLAAGPAAFPALAAQYRTARDADVVTAAAFVLTKGSPQTLSSAVMDRIDAFRPLALSFVQDLVINGAAYAIEGRRIAVGLLALEEHDTQPARIHPLILALSIPEPGFSKYASATLRKTLSAGEFADALFGFLAIRKSYLVIEVDAYRNALTSYDGVSPAIEANLTRLLTAAGGRPEGVPWILKVIGISALAKVGGSDSRPVLRRYERDTGSYLEFSTPSDDPEDEPPASAVERQFAALVQCTLREIDARQGITGSASSSLACAPRPYD